MTRRRRARGRLGGLALTAAVLAGCGGGSGGSSPPTVTSSGGGTGAPPPTSGAVKPTLRGLVAMGKASDQPSSPPTNALEEINAHPGVYTATVIDLFWSQLEPSQGVFDDTALTAALAAVASYNAKYPATPVTAKLRIFMGAGTPAWVIQSTGAVAFTDSAGVSGQVGEFWTAAYQTLWRGLQTHLAAEYDGDPRVSEVAITSCSSLTGEPFIIAHGAGAIAALHAAGYTDALDQTCLSEAADDYAAWKRTPLDYTFNAFSALDSGNGVESPTFAVQLMATFRTALGVRAVVANHGLQSPLAANAAAIYPQFQALYAQAQAQTPPALSPLEFQTFSPTTDWPSAVDLALTYHPTEIEIWDTKAAGGSAPLTQAQLQSWADALK